MSSWIVGHLLAIGIGVSLGLLGGGGSVLAVPILVYAMGINPKSAIAMSLVIVGTVSLMGAIRHWRNGNINFRTAYIFGSATMLGAFGGAKVATLPFVTGTLQMLLFAILMLVAAGFMIWNSSRSASQASVQERDLSLYPRPICKHCWLWLVSEGFGVGALTGLVGVGGGFAIVPALVLLGKIPMKQAIGTSLLIIAMNSGVGFLGYFGTVDLNWTLISSFTLAATLGTVAGTYLAQFVQAKQLQKSFGYFLLAVATFVVFQNRDAFAVSQPADATKTISTSATEKITI
ncbi:MAG: sulfite exporter TauE/SafE family protein [Leptolyngbyaceae cyanobacterium bins.302]|nr:sulfite exporter TauE/SafE family protein [Leptolyngbyaceae cyanobacterium bins.302]